MTGTLGGLLGQDVALEGLGHLDLAGLGQVESFLGTAVGLQLGHGSFSFSYIVLLPGLGGKEYGHTASFQLGLFIQCRHLGTLLGEAHQQVFADVGMRHLAAAEADRDLDAVAVGKELLGILELCVEIADIDAGRHTDLFDLDHVLVLLRFLFALALFKAELAVVHELAHGGRSLRGDLDEVKPLLIGDPLRLGGRHDAELLTGGTDQTDLAVSNVLIELMHILANTEAPPLNDLTKQKRAQPCRTRTTNAKRPRAFSIIDLLACAKGENGCCRSSLFCVGMIPPPPPFVNDNLRKNAVKKKFFHFSAALRFFARRV